MSYNYHWCVVPNCNSTSIKTPEKLFIKVPNDIAMRNIWLKLARRDPEVLSNKSLLYLCEDHFDLKNDMENYTEYKIMGLVKRIRMKPNCKPSRFDCQTDRKLKRILRASERRSGMPLIQEAERTLEDKDSAGISISYIPGTVASAAKCIRTRPKELEEMERLLNLWIKDQTNEGSGPSFLTIKEKALAIHENLKEKSQNPAEVPHFSASNGWFNGFKRRYSFCNVKLPGEVATPDEEATNEFSPEVHHIKCEEQTDDVDTNYTKLNMDYQSLETEFDSAQMENSYIVQNNGNGECSPMIESQSQERMSIINDQKYFVKDEYDIFGECIAVQLRNITSSLARATAKLNIQKVLYDAETGKYN